MPIEKSTWESSESTKSTRAETIEFLKENQSLAYTVRELSDEILGSTWARIHAEEREIEHVGEEVYHQENSDHGLDIVDSFLSREKVNRMWNILDDLVYEGVVEIRFVPGEKKKKKKKQTFQTLLPKFHVIPIHPSRVGPSMSELGDNPDTHRYCYCSEL